MIGPGKYDEPCNTARQATGARAIALIVVAGDKGTGASVQLDTDTLGTTVLSLRALAAVILNTADALEERHGRQPTPAHDSDGNGAERDQP